MISGTPTTAIEAGFATTEVSTCAHRAGERAMASTESLEDADLQIEE